MVLKIKRDCAKQIKSEHEGDHELVNPTHMELN